MGLKPQTLKKDISGSPTQAWIDLSGVPPRPLRTQWAGSSPGTWPQWPHSGWLASHSPWGDDPFSFVPLPLHYHRDSLKQINKYEKQLIFFSPPLFSICPTEWFCLTCLTGITPEGSAAASLRGRCALSLLSTPPSALSAIDFKIGGSAIYRLGRCYGLFWLGPCERPLLGWLPGLLLPLPRRQPQPPSQGPPGSRGFSTTLSQEDREPEQLAPHPASGVHPRALKKRIFREIHISAKSLLLLISKQSSSELSTDLSLVGTQGGLLPDRRQKLVISRVDVHHCGPRSPSSNVICNFIKAWIWMFCAVWLRWPSKIEIKIE